MEEELVQVPALACRQLYPRSRLVRQCLRDALSLIAMHQPRARLHRASFRARLVLVLVVEQEPLSVLVAWELLLRLHFR